MSRNEPAIETWRYAYERAAEIRDLTPWNWLEENAFLAVDSEEGVIVGSEVLTPHPTADAVYRRAGAALLNVLAQHEIRPREIVTRNDRVADSLRTVCDTLGIKLTVRGCLPEAGAAFGFLLQCHEEAD
jgi:hypothetical protein